MQKLCYYGKIFFGYIILVAVIASMAATLLHERKIIRGNPMKVI